MFDLLVIGPQPGADNFSWLLYIERFTFMLTSLFAMTVVHDTCVTADASPLVDLVFNLPFTVHCSL